jgi:hypothetical protein
MTTSVRFQAWGPPRQWVLINLDAGMIKIFGANEKFSISRELERPFGSVNC